MSQVFVHLGISLDGYIAGPNRGPKNPLGDEGTSIHSWMFKQRAFKRAHGMDEDGETGQDNRIIENLVARIGANILGKRMFEEGEANWPEDAPFHGPVFVLTKEKRSPWERKGGTTFYFVNDGIERALERAREVAGKKDVGFARRRATTLRRNRQAQGLVRDRRGNSLARCHSRALRGEEEGLSVAQAFTSSSSRRRRRCRCRS
jgi:dihydrofolate reductase